MSRLHPRGFTIIELLIATVSFSMVLLLITGSIIQFNRVYYKGQITAKTQETTRHLSEDIARTAQFSSTGAVWGAPSGQYQALCFGTKRYNFVRDRQLTAEVAHVITVDTSTSCDAYDASTGLPPSASDAVELLGENMQLLDLSISGGDTTTVTVTVAYGQDVDMNVVARTCNRIAVGGQFCAISTLSTSVAKRL